MTATVGATRGRRRGSPVCDKTYGQYFQINIKQYQPSHAIRFILWGNGDNEWHWNEGTAPREMKVFITSDACRLLPAITIPIVPRTML